MYPWCFICWKSHNESLRIKKEKWKANKMIHKSMLWIWSNFTTFLLRSLAIITLFLPIRQSPFHGFLYILRVCKILSVIVCARDICSNNMIIHGWMKIYVTFLCCKYYGNFRRKIRSIKNDKEQYMQKLKMAFPSLVEKSKRQCLLAETLKQFCIVFIAAALYYSTYFAF